MKRDIEIVEFRDSDPFNLYFCNVFFFNFVFTETNSSGKVKSFIK